MNSAGGRQEKYASDATEWVSSGTTSGQMRLSDYRKGQQPLRFWLEWDWTDERARPRHQVYLLWALPCLA
jgi:hypothetical protein